MQTLHNIKLLTLILSIAFIFTTAAERKFSIEDTKTTAKSVVIKSKISDGSNTYGQKFSFSVLGFPRIRYSFLNNTNDTTAVHTFRVGLFRVVEFNETIKISQSNSSIKLVGATPKWSNINVSEVGNSTVSIQKISSTFTEGTFNLTLTGYVVSDKAFYDGVNLSPTSFKYSLEMGGFDYKYQNSSLALQQGVYSVSAQNLRSASKDIQIDNGSFSWNSTILVKDANGDESSSTVNVVPIEPYGGGYSDAEDDGKDPKETIGIVTFKFNATQPSKIFWDPNLNGDTSSASGSAGVLSKSTPSSFIVLSVMIVVSIVIFFGF